MTTLAPNVTRAAQRPVASVPMLEWLRLVAARVNDADVAIERRIARIPRSPADEGLKKLTIAANHGVLWFIVAAVLASRKGVTRRAALRGVLAIGGASFTTNAIAKLLMPRRRPAADALPDFRTHPDPPTSSSFPSGHAASAAAFTTAVAMESPLAGAVIAPVAATVAYSRMHTGVHWTSDVVGGVLLGSTIAVATKRWWPVRPQTPAQARTVPIEPGKDLAERLDAELDGDAWVVGVAGGDGSVAAAAAVAAVAEHRRLPLVVLPAGTLNHFARDIGVDSFDDSIGALATGDAVSVDLASVRVDGGRRRPFVNTASIGGYPDMVRLRERWQHRVGKWLAAAWALVRVLAEARPLHVVLDGRRTSVWLLFVGNGPYHPRGMVPVWRPALD